MHGANYRYIEFELEQGPSKPGCVANPKNPVDPEYVHNEGAILIAVVAGIVFNVPYATLCINRIFIPLGMDNTIVFGNNPMGGLRSSLQDMNRYGRFFMLGFRGELESSSGFSAAAKGLLRREDFVSLFTPLPHGDPNVHVFGKVWAVGHNTIMHGGCSGAVLKISADKLRTYAASDWPDGMSTAFGYDLSLSTDLGGCGSMTPWGVTIGLAMYEAESNNRCDDYYSPCPLPTSSSEAGERACIPDPSFICANPADYDGAHKFGSDPASLVSCDMTMGMYSTPGQPLHDFSEKGLCDENAKLYLNNMVTVGCCGPNVRFCSLFFFSFFFFCHILSC